MRKILTIAWHDFRTTVLSKAFLVGVFIMPLIMGVLFLVMSGNRGDLRDRTVVVVDGTGWIHSRLADRAEERNRSDVVYRGDPGDREQVAPRFIVEERPWPEDVAGRERLQVELSRAVREDEIHAFLMIAPELGGAAAEVFAEPVAYHSNAPSDFSTPQWLESSINEEIRHWRIRQAGLEPREIARLTAPVGMARRGLVERDGDSGSARAEESDPVSALFVPLVTMMMMFIAVNMGTPLMLNGVMEEKLNRIAELLISAVTPFELMMGKLIASASAALALAGLYLSGTFALLALLGSLGLVAPSLVIWFAIFLVLATFTYGAMWAAVGAACNDFKDTQIFAGITAPVIIAPMLFVEPVIASPQSPLAIAVSLIPPMTPMLMTARIAAQPGPALWEILLGLVISVAFMVGAVWAAGRIFRIGILAQGKAPRWRTLAAWIFRSG